MGWISRKELKIYLVAVASLTLAALLVTLLVLLPDYLRYSKLEKESIEEPERNMDISEFAVPETWKHLVEDKWIPYRKDREKWTREEVEKYWQDPKDAILNYLEKENEIVIDELFKDIP